MRSSDSRSSLNRHAFRETEIQRLKLTHFRTISIDCPVAEIRSCGSTEYDAIAYEQLMRLGIARRAASRLLIVLCMEIVGDQIQTGFQNYRRAKSGRDFLYQSVLRQNTGSKGCTKQEVIQESIARHASINRHAALSGVPMPSIHSATIGYPITRHTDDDNRDSFWAGEESGGSFRSKAFCSRARM